MRVFIAIQLPAAIKETLSGIQHKLKAENLNINWVKAQNLHLTLKFLGDIPCEQLEKIHRIIAEVAGITAGFKIKLEKLGVFPNLRAGRIIWVGANQPPLELKQFAEQLETKLTDTGIPRENRDFCAHITIGRIKNYLGPSDLKKALDKIGMDMPDYKWEFDCEKITLFESVLGPAGPTYTALKEFNLKIT
jgi:2'-5' RNA ligase